MSRMTEIFGCLLDGASPEEISYCESYVFIDRTTSEWITEAESHTELISDDPIFFGEPVNHSIMGMARTSLLVAREEWKKLNP